MRSFIRLIVLFGLACLTVLLPAAAAQASAPATVTVHVEGAERTLLAPTEVTTTSTAVVKDGNAEHSCAGGSAAGALQLATGGSWSGEWFGGFGYSAETILGETHAFEPSQPANFFWSYWLDGKSSSVGICEGELSTGESVLFFPECFSEAEPNPCPPPPSPLSVSAPASAERGSSVTVTVNSLANPAGTISPAVGATVSAGGASATTDAAGHATLVLTQTGLVQLQVTAPNSVRSEATVCVHNGNDGTCGTTSPSGVTNPAATGAPVAPYKGPFAIVATATGLADGHVYSAKTAPKLLRGTVATHTRIASVSLELRRSYRGRCFAYNGVKERFQASRCGAGNFFSVGATPTFSYLLPGALAPGRYVLDIEATDATGDHTSLARGSSRIVFYVR